MTMSKLERRTASASMLAVLPASVAFLALALATPTYAQTKDPIKIGANPLYAARIRADGEVVAANHAAVVDARTFDLVQEKLKENTRNPGTEHRPKMESLLRGLLYCSCCGSAMSPSYSSSKQRRY